jgi:deoxyribodipyrimidine photo-lyase
MSLKNIHIVWFKRDLRVSDNAPLAVAAKAGEVLPLYIVEPELWKRPDSSRRHWHFIHDSLLDLQCDLTALGAPLVIRVGEAMEVLEKLRHELGAFTLWSHEETGNGWTYQRDIDLAQWCLAHNIIWRELPSNGVVRRLKCRDGWAKLPFPPSHLSGVGVICIYVYVPGSLVWRVWCVAAKSCPCGSRWRCTRSPSAC